MRASQKQMRTSSLLFFFVLASSASAACPKPPYRWLDPTQFKDALLFTSYPRSGNHWMRELTHVGTGILTTSIYPHESLPYAKSDAREALYVKTHWPCGFCASDDLPPHSANVHVIRSPFMSFVSLYAFKNDHKHKQLPLERYATKNFDKFLKEEIPWWIAHQTYWLRRKIDEPHIWENADGKRTYLVYYEKLKENPVAEMDRVYEFVSRERKLNLTTGCSTSAPTHKFLRERKYSPVDVLRHVYANRTRRGRETWKDYMCRKLRTPETEAFWLGNDFEWGDCP